MVMEVLKRCMTDVNFQYQYQEWKMALSLGKNTFPCENSSYGTFRNTTVDGNIFLDRSFSKNSILEQSQPPPFGENDFHWEDLPDKKSEAFAIKIEESCLASVHNSFDSETHSKTNDLYFESHQSRIYSVTSSTYSTTTSLPFQECAYSSHNGCSNTFQRIETPRGIYYDNVNIGPNSLPVSSASNFLHETSVTESTSQTVFNDTTEENISLISSQTISLISKGIASFDTYDCESFTPSIQPMCYNVEQSIGGHRESNVHHTGSGYNFKAYPTVANDNFSRCPSPNDSVYLDISSGIPAHTDNVVKTNGEMEIIRGKNSWKTKYFIKDIVTETKGLYLTKKTQNKSRKPSRSKSLDEASHILIWPPGGQVFKIRTVLQTPDKYVKTDDDKDIQKRAHYLNSKKIRSETQECPFIQEFLSEVKEMRFIAILSLAINKTIKWVMDYGNENPFLIHDLRVLESELWFSDVDRGIKQYVLTDPMEAFICLKELLNKDISPVTFSRFPQSLKSIKKVLILQISEKITSMARLLYKNLEEIIVKLGNGRLTDKYIENKIIMMEKNAGRYTFEWIFLRGAPLWKSIKIEVTHKGAESEELKKSQSISTIPYNPRNVNDNPPLETSCRKGKTVDEVKQVDQQNTLCSSGELPRSDCQTTVFNHTAHPDKKLQSSLVPPTPDNCCLNIPENTPIPPILMDKSTQSSPENFIGFKSPGSFAVYESPHPDSLKASTQSPPANFVSFKSPERPAVYDGPHPGCLNASTQSSPTNFVGIKSPDSSVYGSPPHPTHSWKSLNAINFSPPFIGFHSPGKYTCDSSPSSSPRLVICSSPEPENEQ